MKQIKGGSGYQKSLRVINHKFEFNRKLVAVKNATFLHNSDINRSQTIGEEVLFVLKGIVCFDSSLC